MPVNNSKQLWQLSFEGEWPTAVTFLDASRRIAAGNRAGDIYLWDLPESAPAGDESSGKSDTPPDFSPSRRLDGHANAITQLRAIEGGKRLVSSSLDGSVRLWDTAAKPSGTAEVVLDAKVRERKARGTSQQEKQKIIEAPGAKVELAEAEHVLRGHRDWVKAMDVSRDETRIISGDDSCWTVVWDCAARAEVSRWRGYDRVWVVSAALSPDGKVAFTAEFAGRRSSFDRPAAQARLWNADDGTLRLDLLKVWTPDVKDSDRVDSYGYARTWGKLMKRGLVCAQFSPDGKLLAVGQGGETDTGRVHLVDVESGKIVRTVSGHRYGVCDLKFSGDGQYVLSCGRDTTVRICRVSDGEEVAVLGTSRGGQFKDWLHAVAVAPDQKSVAAADVAGMLHVWQLS